MVDQVGELVDHRARCRRCRCSSGTIPTDRGCARPTSSDFPGVWRHGDWIRITPRGSCVIYGRSDSTLNRGGVRMGTSEFYRVVEAFPESRTRWSSTPPAPGARGELLCFLVLAPERRWTTSNRRCARRCAPVSPRHVPDRFILIDEVPRTLNGKKCEVPVKRILAGTPPERAVSRDALRNPEALEPFIEAGASCDVPARLFEPADGCVARRLRSGFGGGCRRGSRRAGLSTLGL